MEKNRLRSESVAEPAVVLSRATLRAAEFLHLTQAELAEVLGLSEATVSRIAHGRKQLETGSKSWQLAALLVRLFRSLTAVVGSDDAATRAWMRGGNLALGGAPSELIRDPAGLARTVDYLDAARARV